MISGGDGIMKRALLLITAVLCLILTGCGGGSGSDAGKAKGPDLNTMAVHSIKMDGDVVKAEVSFDKEYDAVMLEFYSDIDNEKFEGSAKHTHDLGAVEPGKMYTAEVSLHDEWAYSGTFKSISIGNGSLDLSPPDLSQEKINVKVMHGDTELASGEMK